MTTTLGEYLDALIKERDGELPTCIYVDTDDYIVACETIEREEHNLKLTGNDAELTLPLNAKGRTYEDKFLLYAHPEITEGTVLTVWF